MAVQNTIWQYWETQGEKPAFIDGLHKIARDNAGVNVVLVEPENLNSYLPDLEDAVHRIKNPAHKADMIRTRLVKRYGGMWLDSDAIVLKDLNRLFSLLDAHEFIGFNNGRQLQRHRPWVRVNCFLSRPNGTVVSAWVRAQSEKLTKTTFRWSEIGAELLNAICLQHRDVVRILPFERITPIPWNETESFMSRNDGRAAEILKECLIVMLSNAAMQKANMPFLQQTVDEIISGQTLLASILRAAVDRRQTRRPITQGDKERAPALIEVDTAFGPMLTFEGDYITKQLQLYGAHTRTETAFLLSMVEPGDGIFDLGAHIGTFAIPLARKAGPAGRLLAVEGSRGNHAVLARNLSRSGLCADPIVLNALVATPGQHYEAHVPEGNSGGTYFLPGPADGYPVDVTTIDELCERYFVPRIIKLDIEGGELAALASSRVIARIRPIVYAEVNRKLLALQGGSVGELETFFRNTGYRLFRNIAERRAAHDHFIAAELEALPENLNRNIDVLAIHGDDPRIARLVENTQ